MNTFPPRSKEGNHGEGGDRAREASAGTAVDEATRYRILRIYTHNSIPNAIAFIDEVRQRLPMAVQRIQTDHGNEFGYKRSFAPD